MEEELKMKDLMELLNKANKELSKRARDYAESYRNYRITLSQKMVLERDKGTPVTILSDIVRGDKEVADAKYNEIVTEGLYRSCLEAINSYKLQIKILQERINKELEE